MSCGHGRCAARLILVVIVLWAAMRPVYLAASETSPPDVRVIPAALSSDPNTPKATTPSLGEHIGTRHLPEAIFVGCKGAAAARVCVIAQDQLTLRLPLDGAMPVAFASFLEALDPLSPVAVTVVLPSGAAAAPRLTAIRLRNSALPDRIWREIQGSWTFDGMQPAPLGLDGRAVSGAAAQRLLGGTQLWIGAQCGPYIETGLYLAAYDDQRGTTCYRLLVAGPERLSLMHLPLGDQLHFFRTQ